MKSTKRSTTTEIETFEIPPYTCEETRVDGVITKQVWRAEPGFHICNYRPDSLTFYYYENTDFLNRAAVNTMAWEYPTTSLIEDLENFSSFNNLLAVWVGIDGNIYRINKPYPLPVWKHQSYIGGITNKDFKLVEVRSILRGNPNVRNVEVIDIPSYNCDPGRTKTIEFDYRLTPDMIEEVADNDYTNLFYTSTLEVFDPFDLKKGIKP